MIHRAAEIPTAYRAHGASARRRLVAANMNRPRAGARALLETLITDPDSLPSFGALTGLKPLCRRRT